MNDDKKTVVEALQQFVNMVDDFEVSGCDNDPAMLYLSQIILSEDFEKMRALAIDIRGLLSRQMFGGVQIQVTHGKI
ncbi:MAG: hypothetical protein NUV49_00145 [Patescibacteria group bacterium]|nr:hypothetical protein [Patescibacteria group bacterium]